MEIIKSLLLGIIQGLTEFLPVSSSGHLEISKLILGFNYENTSSLFFTLVVHLATALSAIIYFKDDVISILKSVFTFKKDENTFFALMIIISIIPAGLIGYLFEDQISSLFDGNLTLVGFMLIITAIILFFSDRVSDKKKKINFMSSVIIGISQAFAILPGISRSGSTIGTSIFLGIDREIAAKFSFLMVVPVILGSSLKLLVDNQINLEQDNLINYASGFIAALISGYYACKWMIVFVKKSKLIYFSIYCLIVGILSIAVSNLYG